MPSSPFILASQSPRRLQLLQQMGFNPVCHPVDIDETPLKGELALDYCQRLALEKAQAGWQQSAEKQAVLGADTIVVFGEALLGKPSNEADAFQTLMKLSNQVHQVISAIALVEGNKIKQDYSISEVHFATIPKAEALKYIQSQEPMDKAGSYGIQGYAARWIKHISGSYSGIMGLPIYQTGKLLSQFGVIE